jgi:hypothetical protein
MTMTDQAISFAGFKSPDKNYSELPHEFILLLPLFKSLAELKIVLYILRHTWGFHEYDEPKQITTDEFEHGRKNRKGKRIDSGVGMVKNSILDGLQRAVDHGFIEVETDNSDKARIGKSYMLRMFKSCTSEGQTLNPGIPEVAPRTEKPTLEINQETKDSLSPIAKAPATDVQNNLVIIDPLSTVQVRDSGTVSTTIPDSAIVFTGALEPTPKVAEKGSSLPGGHDVWFVVSGDNVHKHLKKGANKALCGYKPFSHPREFDGKLSLHLVECPECIKARDAPPNVFTTELKNALAALVKKDWTIDAHAAEMGKALRQINGKASLEMLDHFKTNWYKCDWRGQKNQPPECHQVVSEWTKLTESDECKDDGSNNELLGVAKRSVSAADYGFG